MQKCSFLAHGKGIVSKLFIAADMSAEAAKRQAGKDAQREFGTVAGLTFFLNARVERKAAFWEVTGSVA